MRSARFVPRYDALLFSNLARSSRRATVRLKIRWAGVVSVSTQKEPSHSNW